MRVVARLRDEGLRRDVLSVASVAGYATEEARSDAEALGWAQRGGVEAMLLEVSTHSDLNLLRELHRAAPELGLVGVSGHPGVDLVVDAFREGAGDFLRMPFDVSSLERAFAQAVRSPSVFSPDATFLTEDPDTLRVLDQLRRVSATEATVRITGESGTGKDLLARRIHQASPRRSGPLVVVGCAGLAPELAESELFGHARGSFTGAVEERQGRIAAADGGTLVLDEVGDLSPSLQPKLLRALQEREVLAIGARSPRAVDIRVVVTTQRDLAEEVSAGRFRADLYYRLDVVTLRIPPLRERPADVPLLAHAFLERFARSSGAEPARLDDAGVERLLRHPLRGNVRELENLARRAAILFPGQVIEMDRLLDEKKALADPASRELSSLNLRDLERAAVIRCLEMSGGNRTAASRVLGISVRTLRNKIRLYELA